MIKFSHQKLLEDKLKLFLRKFFENPFCKTEDGASGSCGSCGSCGFSPSLTCQKETRFLSEKHTSTNLFLFFIFTSSETWISINTNISTIITFFYFFITFNQWETLLLNYKNGRFYSKSERVEVFL